MRIADAIIKLLEKNGTKYIYGISAGTVSAIYDALNDSHIKPIMVKNEAGATYSAARYASLSKKLGVCVLAGGVGINNGINGIADAMRCKVPVLAISGYVHRWQIGKGSVQELDTEDILKPITKYSKTVLKEDEVVSEVAKAIKIAQTPPYGPVHISIPIDLQISPFEGEDLSDYISKLDLSSDKVYDDVALSKAIDIINEEEKGIIFAGKGCRGLSKELQQLADQLNWPIITTPEGKEVVPTDFHLTLGSYGFCSVNAAEDYITNGDATCLLVLGSSLGDSATNNFNEVLINGRRLIQIDWDKKELNKVFESEAGVYYDLNKAIPKLIENTKPKVQNFNRPSALNPAYEKNHTGISTRLLFEKMVDVFPDNTCYTSDIGEYMNFLFKYMPIKDETDFEININYGAMGSGVGGAMGSYLAKPDKQHVVIVGDGSFFMNGTEILTAKEYKMPIIYVVINNSMLGYVYNGHNFIYGRTLEDFKQERFSIANMVKAMGIKAMQINNLDEIENIKGFVETIDEPCVIEVITDGTEKVPATGRLESLSNSSKKNNKSIDGILVPVNG